MTTKKTLSVCSGILLGTTMMFWSAMAIRADTVDSQSTAGTATFTAGSLTIDYVSNFNFQTATLASATVSTPTVADSSPPALLVAPVAGQNYLQVNNSTGTTSTWYLTAKMGNLIRLDSSGVPVTTTNAGDSLSSPTISLPAATLTTVAGNDTALDTTTNTNISTAPTSIPVTLNHSEQTVASSAHVDNITQGLSQWDLNFDPNQTTLNLPNGVRAVNKASYQTTITWTLYAAP